MALKMRFQNALAEIGITTESYYVDSIDVGDKWFPPVWGLALMRDGEDICAIETNGSWGEDGYRNKYALVSGRSRNGDGVRVGGTVGCIKRTQRECLAEAVRRYGR